ncbi:MAG: hypothetical protein NZ750_06950 [Anaerolineae bacterium]|nr:hypothetical protein [Anaerolineae bacterium]MDW8170848.1 SGNH/GDSL hydrolase family protein [Anaerolineae bacterium]
MTSWNWLTQTQARWPFVLRVLLKTGLLLAAFNLIYAALQPLPAIGQLSIYGWLAPYRPRLPYADRPELAYSLSLNSLETMFASHAIRAPKATDEYRVALIGDSSTWGVLLRPEETYAGVLNTLDLSSPDGRRMVFYNLGYPQQSLAKDGLILQEALHYGLDEVLWLVTLEAFAPHAQLDPLIVRQNPARARALLGDELVAHYESLPDGPILHRSTFWDETLFGQRRALADWWRLQWYGLAWASTGLDQHYPVSYPLRSNDFSPQDFDGDLTSWQNYNAERPLTADDLAFGVLTRLSQVAGSVPLRLVNEPIFIADGQGSETRYNFWYPRWAYDLYRELLSDHAQAYNWAYLDLWDAIAPDEFTDSPVHLTPRGAQQTGKALAAWLTR